MNQINDRMKVENREELLNNKDTNESFTIFHNTLQKHINDIAPIKTIKIPPKRILRDEWMTPGLLKCTQKQKKLYKIALVKQNNETAQTTYRTYRNNLKKYSGRPMKHITKLNVLNSKRTQKSSGK